MPEISLPTKVTQDAIKLQTDKIQSIKNDTASLLSRPANAGIKNVQRGFANSRLNRKVITISPVNLAKTFVNAQPFGATTSGAAGINGTAVSYLEDSSTLIIYSPGVDDINYFWEVVEFH
ncbi:hypothetical protein [Sporosarcina sp. D27]|uniref:hypothetical protein n=1 Tax=Sporosarcina sp. D27 TaxID=1382305 RepID=UPI0004722A38|nr:hypothetical protein [Sporosarcina sp. D27]